MEATKYSAPKSDVENFEIDVAEKPRVLKLFLVMAWLKICHCTAFVFYSAFAVSFKPESGFWRGFNDAVISRADSPVTVGYTYYDAGDFAFKLFVSICLYTLVLFSIKYKRLLFLRVFVIIDSAYMLWTDSYLIFAVIPIIFVFLPQIKNYFELDVNRKSR